MRSASSEATAARATAMERPRRPAAASPGGEQHRDCRQWEPELVREHVENENHLAVPYEKGNDLVHRSGPDGQSPAGSRDPSFSGRL
jgi:hypothetical protein